MLGKDRLLKTLVAVATFLVLFSLAVLAILNFAGGDSKDSKNATTSSQKEARSTTTKTQTTQTTKESETSQETRNAGQTTVAGAGAQTNLPAAALNANSGNTGNRAATPGAGLPAAPAQQAQAPASGAQAPAVTTVTQGAAQRQASQVFKSQAEALEYGKNQSNTLVQGGKYQGANYDIRTVRDAQGNVTGYEANVYGTPKN